MHISNLRHQTIFDASQHAAPVTIIGGGGIGSRIFAALVELGVENITVCDFDIVEAHNLANQLFLNKHIGMKKVEALADWFELKTGSPPPESMHFIDERFTEFHQVAGIVFVCVDTMEARHNILSSVVNVNPWVIDTRMASSYGDVLTFNAFSKQECDGYAATLFNDDVPVETTTCGSSISVGMTVSVIANIAVWQFINALTDPIAVDQHIKVFLKPTVVSAGGFISVEEKQNAVA